MTLPVRIQALVEDFTEHFRVGTVSAVVGNKLTVATTGGGSMTIPRLATWTPATNDIVVIAMTTAGWIALGKIA